MVVQATLEKNTYSLIAALLEYPREDMKGPAKECAEELLSHPEYPPEAAEELKAFQSEIKEMSLDDLQGMFTYTFEISSGDFTLDLGYHLHDGFKRASNLLTLKTMYRAHGFPIDSVAGGELPDNLPIMLKFMGFLQDEELRAELRETYLVRAIEKLHKNFERKQDSPYSRLITALWLVIDADVKLDGKKLDGKKKDEGEGS